MSKSLSPKALRTEEAAAANESDVRRLGTPEAADVQSVRSQVHAVTTAEAGRGPAPAVTEAVEPPSFDEALAEIQAIEQGDNTAADTLSHKYGNREVRYVKRIPSAPDGGLGWHCVAHDKSPLTSEQSRALAEAINGKVDLEKMRQAAERSRAKRERQTTGKTAEKPQPKVAPKAINPDTLRGLLEAIESAEDLKKLSEIVRDADRLGLIVRIVEGKKWRVEAIEGLEKSHELAQAIDSKKKKLIKQKYITQAAEQREQKQLEARIAGLVRAIGEKNSDAELERYVWQFLVQKLGVVKKVNLKDKEWTVEAVENKAGSGEVVRAILARKEALEKAVRAATESKYRK